MYRIAVVDDELQAQQEMEHLLREYAAERGETFEIICYEDGADFMEDFHDQYDIIFCDIRMKFTDGITAAREIRERNSRAILFFTTNLTDYAIQGYEVEASGYLLKPISKALLARNLSRALRRLKTEDTAYLVIEGTGKVIRIPAEEILYIDCLKHYQYIHTTHETQKVLTPLSELEAKLTQLDPRAFRRCNSGCLVHLKYASRVEKKTVTVGGDVLTISRGKEKDFMAALTAYLTERM